MVSDEARLLHILVSAQPNAAKLRPLVTVPVFDAVEPQLVLEQVTEQPGKTPG
jgi:hypothetical protein